MILWKVKNVSVWCLTHPQFKLNDCNGNLSSVLYKITNGCTVPWISSQWTLIILVIYKLQENRFPLFFDRNRNHVTFFVSWVISKLRESIKVVQNWICIIPEIFILELFQFCFYIFEVQIITFHLIHTKTNLIV